MVEVRSGFFASYSFSHRPFLFMVEFVFVPPSYNMEALLGIPRDVYSLLACKAGFFHSWILGCNRKTFFCNRRRPPLFPFADQKEDARGSIALPQTPKR